MKITLKAHIAEHREIAKMFVWCKTQSGELLGFHKYYMNGRFATQHNSDFHTMYSDEITIDLSKAEMDLRMAIGTDIEFEVYCDGGEEGYFHCKSEQLEAIEYCGEIKIDGEWVIPDKIQLSKDYLERIGVTIEGGEG